MRKYTYKFHPNDYALGENEKFYSDMEAKGWRLVKRGVYLSKFESVEPGTVRYRIEVVDNKFLEEPGMTDAQVAVFEDCGWEYVTYSGMIHVFRAPAGSDAPEFYADPRQQAATLKGLRRSYLLAWLPVAIVIALNLTMTMAMRGSVGETLVRSAAEYRVMWVRYTAFFAAFLVFLLWTVYNGVRGIWYISRTYRRMKKGIPLDHRPKSRNLLHRVIKWGSWGAIACFLLLFGWQVTGTSTGPLPVESDDPYLLLWDMGFEGERTYLVYRDNESQVEHSESLLAEVWMTREALGEDNSSYVWMYQDVYRLKDAAMAEDFAWTLMSSATFIQEAENFVPTEVPGLDAAWTGGLEIVAVKGELVTYITCLRSAVDNEKMIQRTLEALAEKWQ